MIKITSVLIKAGSGPGFSFGVSLDRNGDKCIKDMYILKVVSRGKMLVFKGF